MFKLFFKASLLLSLLSISIAGLNLINRGAVVEELIESARTQNIDQFVDRFNWQATRDFAIQDLLDKKRKTGQNFDIGPDADDIPEIVEFYIQRKNTALLFYLKDQFFPDVPYDEFIWDTGFHGLTGFSVTIGYPIGRIPRGFAFEPALAPTLRVQVVFELDGLTWKVKGLKVPLFMVPTQKIEAPEEAYDSLYQYGDDWSY